MRATARAKENGGVSAGAGGGPSSAALDRLTAQQRVANQLTLPDNQQNRAKSYELRPLPPCH